MSTVGPNFELAERMSVQSLNVGLATDESHDRTHTTATRAHHLDADLPIRQMSASDASGCGLNGRFSMRRVAALGREAHFA